MRSSSPWKLPENRSAASQRALTSASSGLTPLPPFSQRNPARNAAIPVTPRATLGPER